MITNKKKRNLAYYFELQQGRCCFCKATLNPLEDKTRSPLLATVEHRVPVTDGGTNARYNSAASCSRCNQYRGPLPFDIFLTEQLWLSENNKKRKELLTQLLVKRIARLSEQKERKSAAGCPSGHIYH